MVDFFLFFCSLWFHDFAYTGAYDSNDQHIYTFLYMLHHYHHDKLLVVCAKKEMSFCICNFDKLKKQNTQLKGI